MLQYRTDYNNRPSHVISFSLLLLVRLEVYTVILCLLFLQTHRDTDRFLAASGVQLEQANFHFRCTVLSSQLKSKVGHILTEGKTLRIKPQHR